jgi:O-antigen ligase
MRPPQPVRNSRPHASPHVPPDAAGDGTLFAGLFGLLLGLGLLKFGNPILLDHLVETPANFDEWRVFSWPIRLGWIGLAIVGAVGLRFVGSRWRTTAPPWLLGLLAFWFLWQIAATVSSQDRTLSRPILAHFTACVACFALGHFALARVAQPRTFWLCLTAGFIGVLGMAFDQHFGGLEATRRMILQNAGTQNLSPEYLARIQSNRVFSTLVYPNALAGVILLLLPMAIWWASQAGRRWGHRGAWLAGGILGASGLAVLVWSGSKSAWLLTMAATLLLLALSPIRPRTKTVIALVFIAAGLSAFTLVFREKLSRGATSVSARFDYWTAAVSGFVDRPVLGHGPGLFKRVYAERKRPESEMAQLAHNDYLQQATDSGLPGALAYLGWVAASLLHLFRRQNPWTHPLPFTIWLGLTAWFAHGMVEFGLYIPASAWCAFALLGWCLAQPLSIPSKLSPKSSPP